MFIIPLWVIVLFSATNIVGIYWCSKLKETDEKKSPDEKRREKLSMIPRAYFFLIYLSFWIFNTDLEIRAVLGRYGILAILFFDSWIKFAEIFDHYWETSWKYKSKYKF